MAVQTRAKAPVAGYKIVKTYPHDRQAFTQGLQYVDGFLYEGTGQNGQSGIRKVELETGKVLQRAAARREVLRRGHHRLGRHDRAAHVAVRDRIRLRQGHVQAAQDVQLTGEGWGLTHDGKRLIMSDGDARGALRFFDPATLKETGRLVVRDGGAAGRRTSTSSNSCSGDVLANVWQTHRIARISPKTGDGDAVD